MQHNAAVDLIMSASADKRAAVWIPEPGILVGEFGQQQLWDCDDPKTWKDSSQAASASLDLEKHLQHSGNHSSKPLEGSADDDRSVGSDDGDVYSSGDEMLPDCFMEPPAAS